jgi:hypothetical protein
MFDTVDPDSSTWAAYLFWIVFMVLMTFIMIQLFTLIILESFEQNYINEDNPVANFSRCEEDFKTKWVQFTRD